MLSTLGSRSFQDKCVPKLELGNEERRDRAESLRLQQFERFRVAAALEEVAEFGIDLRREGMFEPFDLFGNVAQSFGVAIWIGAALLVADYGEAFAEGGREVG